MCFCSLSVALGLFRNSFVPMLYDLFPYGGKELCLLSFIDIDDERKMAVNKVKVTR